ncbi:MAG: hypothetical protein WDW38_008753 [Sanguina aurantia]
MPAPAYADIGKSIKELTVGGRTGTFQYDPKVSYSGSTSTGVAFTATATQKSDRVDASLKAAYATKKYTLEAVYNPSNKVNVSASYTDLAPGVKITGSVVLPDPSSAKLGAEYSNPYVNLKANVGLVSSPVVDFAMASGYKSVIVGGEVAYDTAKASLSKYNFGVGYHAPDHQAAAFLQDRGSALRLSYAHNITPAQTVGAEIVRKLATSDTSFTLAYSRKLSNGALSKFKVDNAGLMSVLYETKLTTGEKVAGSLQMQATDLTKPIKYGFALELQ